MTTDKIKILDISILLPGPFASHLLGKYLDATVVKVEDVNQPDSLANMRPTSEGIGLGYTGINSNKNIVRVDFRKDGISRILSEASDATIILENFKSGRAFKLGLGFEDLLKVTPNIIYCSITGYPENHLLNKNSAHDLNILALSGFLDQQLKISDSSFLPPILLADIFTSYNLVVQLLSALVTQKFGTHLKISMFEALQEALILTNYPQLQLKQDFNPTDYIMSGKYPCYALYSSKDNGKVAVAALEAPLWTDFCHKLGHLEWIDRQFDKGIFPLVSVEMLKYDRAFWLNSEFDFCVTPVLTALESKEKLYV